MASVSSRFTLLVLSLLLASSLSDGSRKKLRNKEGLLVLNKENASSHIVLGHSINPNSINPTHVVQISWQPRVFLYRDFLSAKECDYLISLAHDVKESSLSKKDGHSDVSANRRLTPEVSLDIKDNIIARIEERISLWTLLPKENGEPLQVMHYEHEQDKQNLNYFTNKTKLESRGALMATVVLYLSNAAQGGQILFPKSEPNSGSMSDCRESSEILKPVKGNAILFFSLHLSALPDKNSLHARCPILKGDMWTAIKYFYARPINGRKVSTISDDDDDDDDCTDEDDNCPAWAAFGECQKNPVFMIGSPDYYGSCRKSCNAC